MGNHNQDYSRRRRVAEEIVERDQLMPDFLVGPARMAMYEQLVNQHMPPPSDQAFAYEAPERQFAPSPEEVTAVLGRPTPIRDDLERKTSMSDAIGAEMAMAEQPRRGESEMRGSSEDA